MVEHEITRQLDNLLWTIVPLATVFLLTYCGRMIEVPTGSTTYHDLDTIADFLKELWLPHNIYKGSLSDDHRTFYFFRKLSPDQDKYAPYHTSLVDGKWEERQIMDFYEPENSYTYPLKVPGTSRLLFLSTKRMAGDTSKHTNYNFWWVDLNDTNQMPMEFGSKKLMYHFNSQPSLSADGTLYFTSDLPDWSATQAYKMEFDGASYAQPELFEPVNQWRKNRDWTVYEYCMAPDENYLIVCIQNDRDPEPSADLYFSAKEGDSWFEPRRLLQINTTATENFPVITQDGKYLIFTRAFSQFKIVPIALLR